MTNAEKFLKDGVDIKEIAYGINEAYFDSYVEKNLIDCIYRWFETKTKPTLTENERVILNFIKNFDYIGRDEKGLYYKLQDKDVKEKTTIIYNLTTNLFQFIKNGEEYSIKELLNEAN